MFWCALLKINVVYMSSFICCYDSTYKILFCFHRGLIKESWSDCKLRSNCTNADRSVQIFPTTCFLFQIVSVRLQPLKVCKNLLFMPFVCIYIYIYICVCVCVCVRMRARMYVCIVMVFVVCMDLWMTLIISSILQRNTKLLGAFWIASGTILC